LLVAMLFHTPKQFKSALSSSSSYGLVLDIDETLAATNVAWFERCIELFGNPENLTTDELICKYHLAQNNPAWQSKEAVDWMHAQRTSPNAQDDLPIIPNAVKGVEELCVLTPVVGYLTVRPETVNSNTLRWLKENGFPELPIVAKPVDVPFEEGNRWKAKVLHELWPEVTGIVDDNPKVPMYAGRSYPGDIYLFGKTNTQDGYEFAIPCETWGIVVETVRNRLNRN